MNVPCLPPLLFFLRTHWHAQGMDVVKKIEAVGTRSGTTSAPVEIVDCGQIQA
jgi:hypothetical protein